MCRRTAALGIVLELTVELSRGQLMLFTCMALLLSVVAVNVSIQYVLTVTVAAFHG